MAIWLLSIILAVLTETSSTNEIGTECNKTKSYLGGDQLLCTNVTVYFFKKFSTPLNRTHWLSCENCTLTSIDVDTFPFPRNNVSYLYLTHSKIRTLKKLAFSRFPLVKVLNLRDNFIENVDAKCFNGLKRLLTLDLSRNNIRILINDLFSELNDLDILNLNKNQIFYVQPEAFVGLKNIKYLYMNDNELNKLEARTFRHLINLKILHIQNNNIIEIHPLAFFNLNNLNFLYLNGNHIQFLDQYNFQPLANLIDLQLQSNDLKEIQTSSFNGLKSLKNLILSNNNLSQIKPYGFIGLNSLQILDLTRNNFELFSLDFIVKDLKNLLILWVRENSISNITLEVGSDVQKIIQTLDLSGNNITDFNYKLIYSTFPNLKDLFLVNNTLSCDSIVSLDKFYRNVNITACFTENCTVNSTKLFIDEICKNEEENNETDTDFSSEIGRAHV